MTCIAVVFPHQLFSTLSYWSGAEEYLLIESPEFFTQFFFHKKKLLFHYAAMRAWEKHLYKKSKPVFRLNLEDVQDEQEVVGFLKMRTADHLVFLDPADARLEDHVHRWARRLRCGVSMLPSPSFLCDRDQIENAFSDPKNLSMIPFYIQQRKDRKILLDTEGKAQGGHWTFDTEKKLSLPQDIEIPQIARPRSIPGLKDCKKQVETHFPNNPGSTDDFEYPVATTAARKWLTEFLRNRLSMFGPYVNTMDKGQPFLFHSAISPLLNIGLLTPQEVIDKTVQWTDSPDVPIQSVELFLRQILGWREFMHAVAIMKPDLFRKSNWFDCTNPLPTAFYTAQTGIEPVDIVIRRVLKHAYCHHHERLMVLGTFMLFCEICPKDVNRWFMELFIDAYDWVTVSNTLGMSQFTAGPLITAKPYLCSSGYLLKMSNFQKGSWCQIWDSLYWRFIIKHKKKLQTIPQLAAVNNKIDEMPRKMQKMHISNADEFLNNLFTS